MVPQTRAEAVGAFGRALRQARAIRDGLPPHEAARLAYTPGGPPVAELEGLIIRHRAEARAALAAQQAAA
jgi:hypothetical protein